MTSSTLRPNFCDQKKISGGEKAWMCRLGQVARIQRSRSSYHSRGRSGWCPPCSRIWVPPKRRVSSIFRAISSRVMT